MNELQSKLVEMLHWFDGFCIKNEFSYYAVDGTMLGVARHAGFIPWDDDIDVCLPRPDYEKMKSKFGNTQIGKYYLEMPNSNDEAFASPYAKLYDTSTTLIEHYQKPLIRGVFIDIFPLDSLSCDEGDAIKKLAKIKRKQYFFMSRVVAYSSRRKVYKNLAIIFSKIIPHSIVSNKQLRIEIDALCKSEKYDINKWGGMCLSDWGRKEIMPLSVFGKPTRYKFENIEVFGVQNFDTYLTRVYGNWEMLPPEAKRVSRHDYLSLDLNKSYLEL